MIPRSDLDDTSDMTILQKRSQLNCAYSLRWSGDIYVLYEIAALVETRRYKSRGSLVGDGMIQESVN